MLRNSMALIFLIFATPSLLRSADAPTNSTTVAERGYKALTETAFIPGFWSRKSLPNAWKHWDGVKDKPSDYDAALRDRYGL